jgi:hypothetical protein
MTEAGELALDRIRDRCIEEVRIHSARHAHIRVPGRADIHEHPLEPFMVRFTITQNFDAS